MQGVFPATRSRARDLYDLVLKDIQELAGEAMKGR